MFAGPGGLGEGFASLGRFEETPKFRVILSVEMEESAYRTLQLRSFFRQFPHGEAPREYYQVLRGEISAEELFFLYPNETEHARSEVWNKELGENQKVDRELDREFTQRLSGVKHWILLGGPPCQAYSLAGRSRNRGVKGYKPEEDKRHFLYKEYLKILGKYHPSVFVMENVKGILTSKINGKNIFNQIVEDLQNPGPFFNSREGYKYKIFSFSNTIGDRLNNATDEIYPTDFIVKAENYGIPQARHRVILLGVREDLCRKKIPQILQPESKKLEIEQFILGLPRIRSGLSRESDTPESWKDRLREAKNRNWLQEVRNKAGEDVHNLILGTLEKLKVPLHNRGAEFIKYLPDITISYRWWFLDSAIGGVCNHFSKSHMHQDLDRYLYASCYAKVHNRSPRLSDFPPSLLPDHKNTRSGYFEDRFRVQMLPFPSTTVTCHIAKDGHYFIHPDPKQCRSLTVREAARLQTFPDNYFFRGSRTQQYTQVGNAVPPLLAYKMAEVVWDFISDFVQ